MLTGRIDARISVMLLGAGDHATPQADIDLDCSIDITSGVGQNQADLVFSDQRTLLASASENLDVAGVLADLLGNVLTMVKIKAVLIRASITNSNNVVVGNGSNPFLGGFGAAANTWAVPPGGVFLVAAPLSGWPSTAGSADTIKIANGGGGSSVNYDIVILGTSS